MQFSNTTTKLGLIQKCELFLGLPDGAISGDAVLLKQFTGLLNDSYHKVDTMILESQDDWDFDDLNKTDFPIATTPLVASQRDYALPSGTLKIKRLDATYDGTNYYRANPMDIATFSSGVGNDTNIDAHFEKTSPVYDLRSNSVLVYPLATSAEVAAGAKIRAEFVRAITEFTSTDTTTEPGIDKPFHIMLAIDASLNWAMSRGLAKKNDLAALFSDWETRLRKHYGRKDEDMNIRLASAYQDYE